MESSKNNLGGEIEKVLKNHNGKTSRMALGLAAEIASTHSWNNAEFVEKWLDFNKNFVTQYVEKSNYNLTSHRMKFFMTWLDLNDEDREYLTIDSEKWQQDETDPSSDNQNRDNTSKDEPMQVDINNQEKKSQDDPLQPKNTNKFKKNSNKQGINCDYNDENDILKLYGIQMDTSSNIEEQESVDNTNTDCLDESILAGDNLDNTVSDGEKVLEKFGKPIEDWTNEFNYEINVKRSEDPHISSNEAFMYDNLGSLNEVLNSQNGKISKRLIEMWLKDDDKTLISYKVREKTLDTFRTWGRICCDDEGKLNNVSVVLSGSDNGKYVSVDNDLISSSSEDSDSEYEDDNDNGNSANINVNNRNNITLKDAIPLDMRNIPSYSIFPGQIVGVEGKNPTKSAFIPTKIIPGLLSYNLTTPKLNNPLKIVVAAGPFSNSNSHLCESFLNLMSSVQQNKPNLLILIGPFFPISSTLQPNQLSHQTYQERFERLVEKIMEYVESTFTKVVIVSSFQETHQMGVYPTPEYTIRKSLNKPNLFMMPDPCMLDIDGLYIAVTSVDVIRHLSTAEYSFKMPHDRLARLANHLLLQSSFYPLIPGSSELPIDRIAWSKYCQFHRQPHILILPSDVRYFHKWNHKTLCLNPSRMNKSTFSRLNINVPNEWTEESINGEIVKI